MIFSKKRKANYSVSDIDPIGHGKESVWTVIENMQAELEYQKIQIEQLSTSVSKLASIAMISSPGDKDIKETLNNIETGNYG